MTGPTWYSADPPPECPPIGPGGWWRVAWRGAVLVALNFGGLAVLLALRLAERPLCGAGRPVTGRLVQGVCRATLAVLGIRRQTRGAPMQGAGAVVANHGSWLDIFVLNAAAPVTFVSKAEVAGWPGIGWLARATGTVFVARDPRQARAQAQVLAGRLAQGHRLVLFPEGTSSDGQRVLPFKPTLLAALFAPDLPGDIALQPVSVRYQAPEGADPRFYGWWGDMELAPHLLQVLAMRRPGAVRVTWHPPMRAADFAGRKALARAAEEAVRKGCVPGGD